MSKYPIGAKWKGIGQGGDYAIVELSSKHDGWERWVWTKYNHQDHRVRSDHTIDRQSSIEEAGYSIRNFKTNKRPRFKRIKES